MTYNGKTAFITGGANGIGKAFATLLSGQGAQICIADINQEAGEKTAQELNDKCGQPLVTAVSCDVTDFKNVLSAFASARMFSKQKRIDIVISNAGTLDLGQPQYPAQPAPSDIEEFYATAAEPNLKCVDLGLLGSLYVCHVALAQFRSQGPDSHGARGRIILAGSEAGIIAMPGDVLYGVAKASMISLARSLGVRVASEGIYVNAYAPNLIETGIMPPEAFIGARSRNTLTQPHQLASAAADVFINPSSKLSGQILGACGSDFELRAIPVYFSPEAEQNADIFFDPAALKEAQKGPEGTKFRAL